MNIPQFEKQRDKLETWGSRWGLNMDLVNPNKASKRRAACITDVY